MSFGGKLMFAENEKCCIEIKEDKTYIINSSYNLNYDLILNPENYCGDDYYKVLSIKIDLFSKKLYIALIGSYFSSDFDDCAILDNDILTVLQGNTITQIKITDGSMVRHIKFDDELYFEIHKIKEGYIIYGELEIIMLDFDFIKKWSFAGEDIFISISGKIPFKLKEDRICLYDFLDNYYEIDFNGNLIV